MKIALIAAVNKYQRPGNDLRGCLNDAEAIRQAALDMGFSPLHIKVLRDSQATKSAILSNLTRMVKEAHDGDNLLFHFSAHGTQVPDQDNDEPDKMDEALCPWDFNWQNGFIRDDDLRRILSGLNPKATIDIILDACHSGTGVREGNGQPRCIPFPIPIAKTWNPAAILRGLDQSNVALWAGCRSNQTSADAYIDKKYRGAMTWALCRALTNCKGYHRQYLLEYTDKTLRLGRFDQEPQLECSDSMRERAIFS